MTRTMAFPMVLLTAFAGWGCGGATDGSSDSTEATHTASDEISTDTDGGAATATGTATDGGTATTTKDGDGGEGCGGGKPGK
jgi:hypothetical protein